MNLVKATKKDLTSIMAIIGDAQEYLKDQNIDQWQNDYPNTDIILNDILNKESYLVKSNSDNVIATAMFSTRLEPTYKVIDGKWMSSNSDKYGVIHRMAIAKKNRRSGVSKFIFKTFELFMINLFNSSLCLILKVFDLSLSISMKTLSRMFS